MSALSTDAIQHLFDNARTYRAWRDKPISRATLQELVRLTTLGPTSMNCQPGRYVFITSAEGKQKLCPALSPGNVEKTMSAPVTVILAMDPRFYDRMPEFNPHNPKAGDNFASDLQVAESTAFRNGTLQGAYLIMAARSLGLDTGPMSGFKNQMVDDIFFAENGWKSNFLLNLGYGDPGKLHPRLPRPAVDSVAQFV